MPQKSRRFSPVSVYLTEHFVIPNRLHPRSRGENVSKAICCCLCGADTPVHGL